MNSLRNNLILALSITVILVAVLVTSYNMINDAKENERNLADIYTQVSRTYDQALQETVVFAEAKTYGFMRTPGVIEAYRKKDHDKLVILLKTQWETMQKENPSLIVLQLHNADGTSLLRVHQPLVFGDPIAKQRPMVAFAHRTQQIVSGFEEGRRGLAYRILIPVYDDGNYLGAVEFGIASFYFTEKIRNFTGNDAFFFIDQKILGQFGRIEHNNRIGDFIGVDLSGSESQIIHEYAKMNQRLVNDTVVVEGKAYLVNVLKLKNFQDRSIGAILFVRPTVDFEAHQQHMMYATALIITLLIGLIVVGVTWVSSIISKKMGFLEHYSQTILDAVPAPVIVTDGVNLTAANSFFLDFFNYKSIDAFRKEHRCVCDFFSEGDTDEYLLPMVDDKRWTDYVLEHPLKNHKAKIIQDGKTTVFEVKISVMDIAEDIRYVVIFNDISTLQKQTLSDPLTGAANRLHFNMVFDYSINVVHRTEKPLSLIILDIDHFKAINDRYGHMVGDKVLKQLVRLISLRIRKSDVLARWGGEEFIILLPATDLNEAVNLAEAIRRNIEISKFDEVPRVTCSFGVAQLQLSESGDDFLVRADTNLYAAKTNGRNIVMF